MKVLIFLLASLVFIQPLIAGGNTVLSQLTNPMKVLIKGDNLIISEKSTIHIYSLKDFKLKTSFGKTGEGPQEFLLSSAGGFPSIEFEVDGDHILVTSMGKISLFSLNGKYEKEMKIRSNFLEIKPMGDQYVIWVDFTDKKGDRFREISLFDKQLEKVKEVAKIKNNISMKAGLQLYKLFFRFRTYRENIYISASNRLLMDVFDNKGKKLYSIERKHEKQAVTKEDKDSQIKSLKLSQPGVYEYFKNKIFFPEFFPAIRDFIVTDGRIYLFTHKKIEGKTECLVLDLKGKLLKKSMLPLNESDPRRWYPFTVNNGKIYQLIENEETNDWELTVIDI